MPARIHAVIVVRPDGATPAAFHLKRTLAALDAQSRAVDAVTVVVCGGDERLTGLAADAGAGVVVAPASTKYGAAVARAPIAEADALWLLTQDTAPEPEALTALAGALELSPSVALVAPKLVRWDDRSEIVSLGVGMTRFGRSVEAADGELDQGQHDGRDDAMGADVRGMLVRRDAWERLGGLDPALHGADEGLDLAVRARLAGGRVSLVPAALVATAGDGVAGTLNPSSPQRVRRRAYARRAAQLHRRLAYAPLITVPLHWLSLLPLALWASIVHIFRKDPGLIAVEWAASVVTAVRLVSLARARRRIARTRAVSWSQLAPLRVTRAQERERLDEDPDAGVGGHVRSELRFFAGGGMWLVLGALVVSVSSFTALLAWPVLGGGALQPLQSTVAQLWADAAFGARAVGLDTVGPADPFAAIVALLGSLASWEPSRAVVALWVLALPLAALGGWFAATRVTDRSVLRIMGGAVWALAPTFVVALTQGRPAAVIAHLLLPWLFYAGSVAHRSWSAAGAASLLLVPVIAAAPTLAPALLVLWFVIIVLAAVLRAGQGIMRVIWVIVPTLVIAAPLVWHSVAAGSGWGLLADPGVTWSGPQVGADAAGRALLVAGIPTTDLAGWTSILPDGPTWWVPLLSAPLALLALVAPLTVRWAAGLAMLGVTALGVATAFGAVGVAVAFAQSTTVALWPGAGLSLAWLGAAGGALVALDTGLAPRLAAVRGAVAVVATLAIAVLAMPALTSAVRGTSMLELGTASTLPAFVAAEGRDDPDVGTIVLTPQADGALSARVVWGGSETLGGQSTIVNTRTEPSESDVEVAEIAVDLVTAAADDVVGRLAGYGVEFVLLAPADQPESDAARSMRLTAQTSLDQRETLDSVGDTVKGGLWRVTDEVAGRVAAPAGTAGIAAAIAASQLLVVAVALLLSLPTAASRRAARRTPRIVGPHWKEGR
ncbi:GT2 family glycosyltransferase [Microbacterium terrae]|uniref:Glycosyl transferase family 2 n=1 Tax=Microbacterium terrae TaxID=69369 RepID=A0A0M2H5H7_9MICO|nr:glycosyltransferase [Microbacterium terrae]KJL41745.1 hypothetical protein RS81_01330 [Microbacterium terrae]MBP1077964.1 GT2 family glycosyltransferase [Microbacterium terrae]GLK00135.1 hypothetical protein GCM10017594_33320 [Microbacterium terrae]